MFYSGFGVPQDYVQAAAWFRTAANLGDPTAQHLHLDYGSADAWYSRALENGDRSAEPRLKALSSRDDAEAVEPGACVASIAAVAGEQFDGYWTSEASPVSNPQRILRG